MARAHGARAQLALAFESVYGTAPATGYRTVPFASTTLGSEQPLIASELLGQGRDPLAPIKDAVTADGDVVVLIDVENLGLWLKAAFGQPTTTGTTPKTHTFQSGNWTLPSMAIETAMPEVPRYAMYTGCVCDQLSWQMARSGLLTATARLVAQGESVAAATAAGTPTSLALQRFGHFNGAITRNGSPLGNVISAEVTYSNGLDRIETIRSDGRIEGADPGMAALTGRVEVRFADTALITQAIDGTPCELVFAWSLGANASFWNASKTGQISKSALMPSGETGTSLPASSPTPSQSSTARRATALAITSASSSCVAVFGRDSMAGSARAETIRAVVRGATCKRRPGARVSHTGAAVRFSLIMINSSQRC